MKIRSLLLSLVLAPATLYAENQAIDLDKAKETAETICAACHNADGNSELALNPKIAGQIPEYLFKQLKEFKSWNDEPSVRDEPSMAAMAGLLEESDMHALSLYFGAQIQSPDAAKNPQTIEQGQKIWRGGISAKGVPACSACHGPTGAGMPAQFPRIAGQFSDYTVKQLQAFREGERSNDPSEMMQVIALKMTDAEIRAVSDYAAGLH